MNIDAEKGLLAAFCQLEDIAIKFPFKIQEEDFLDKKHKVVYRVINHLVENGQLSKISKDILNSTSREIGLTDYPYLTDDGEYIEDILKIIPTEDEAVVFASQVKRESVRRTILSKVGGLEEYLGKTDDKLKTMIQVCEDTIFKITSSADYLDNKPINLASKVREHITFLGNNPGLAGLDIGFPEWQTRIGGICNGMVHLIIATNKTGKSSIGARAAVMLGQYIPILIVDTEMSDDIQIERLFCMFIKLPYTILKNGFWNDPNHPDYKYNARILQGVNDFEKIFKIEYLSASSKSVRDLVPAMRRWIIENKLSSDTKFPKGLIIYDYLKLNSFEELGKSNLQEYQKLGLDAAELKDFANKYKVPIITFGQTNREDDNSINCLGASKRLADLCDSVTLFKEKTPELKTLDPDSSHLLRVFVSRHGPATSFGEHIRVNFNKNCGQMEEVGLFTATTLPVKHKKNKVQIDENITTLDEYD